MIIPCDLALKECLPCNDDPIRNITAESPDVNVFIGFRDFKWNPPLGVSYFQLACKAICFSEVSQEEANLCALENAQDCVYGPPLPPGPPIPPVPPVPPGPDGNNKQNPNSPPPISRFSNTVQTCDALCPDGSPFTETVPAGTITELSQAVADDKAHSLACRLAQQNLFCISGTVPSACVGDSYFAFVTTNTGIDLIWSIEGDLPPGLTFDFVDATITGMPTVGGSYTFIVEVTDSLGRSQSKVLTICVMEIVTETALPNATIGSVYAVPLIQQPATVSSEVWTLVSGSLPPGIVLAQNGSLTGIPTIGGISEFTLRVDATCNDIAVSCQKDFTLEVFTETICLGYAKSVQDAIWTPLENAIPINITNGDGAFSAVAPFTLVGMRTTICNPGPAYNFTVDAAWTVAGYTYNIYTIFIVVLNGVINLDPYKDDNGDYTYNFSGQFHSGTNTLELQCASNGYGPGTVNGTCTIRPLTPP